MKVSIKNILNQPAGVMLLFVTLSVSLRFFSFFPSVIDHDESTYLEIARELLEGKTLYVDLIDIKPPGIFLMYALFQLLFGHSIFVTRLIATLFIAATSFMIFKFGKMAYENQRAGIAGGLIYILFVSTWTVYGFSPNCEIYYNLFTISALYVLMKREHWLNYLAAGLVMGLGFIIKYNVLFDLAAFMFFFFLKFLRQPSRLNLRNLLVKCMIAVTGFVIPFALINFYYYLSGHFASFAEVAYFTMTRYSKEFRLIPILEFVGAFILFFAPFIFFYFYALFDHSLVDRRIKDLRLLSVIWSLFVLVGILLPGHTFSHYFIQLMLPVSLLAGLFFHPGMQLPVLLVRLTRSVTGLIILIAFCILLILFSYRDYGRQTDTPTQIANYMRPRLQPDDVIYCGNYNQIIYYLLEKDSPTPYVHQSLLLNTNHIEALKIDLAMESRRIMDQWPVYIVIQGKKYKNKWINQFIRDHYFIEKQFQKDILLYRLKGGTIKPAS